MKPHIQYKPVWDLYTRVFSYPRFSYRCLKTRVRRSRACSTGCVTGVYRGGVWYRGGYGEGYTGSPARCPGRSPVQRSGPRKPCKGWSGWYWGPGALGVRRRGRPWYHPPGPVGLPWEPSLYQDLANAAPGPKGRDFSHISIKLVKRTECHQNMSIRPVIVPVSKTGLESRLLIF